MASPTRAALSAALLALALLPRLAAAEPPAPPAPPAPPPAVIDPALAHDRWLRPVSDLLRQPVAPETTNGVLVVGSSSVFFWKDAAADLKPWPVVRRGIGGFGLIDLAHYARALMSGLKPRLVVIYAGENDIDAGRSPAEVVAALEQTVRSWEGYKGPIVFMGLKPSPTRWSQWQKMTAVNEAVKQLAQRLPQVRYLEVAPSLMDRSGHPDPALYMPDGLHLNRAGYERWAGLLKPVIAANMQ